MPIKYPYQIGVSAEGELVPIRRYSVDVCTCGHSWAEHYQPKRGGRAACWASPNRLLCSCHEFELVTTRNAKSLPKE